MAIPTPLDTGLTSEQVLEAFRRALNDMTDEQINAKFAEIEEKISALKTEEWKWIKLST